MHPTCTPHASRRSASGWHVPGVSRHRFRALRVCAARSAVLAFGAPNARHPGCLRHAQEHHGRGIRLVPGLLQVRLHQGRKGHIWLCPSLPIQGFDLSPGLHVSGQRAQRIHCHACDRLYRSSRSTGIVQLDARHQFARPALGIQHVLCVHPVVYHFVTCG